mmetsp:Transcript_7677/g.19235  ORF Transcript_7677/g.19235 Transcript_7677/m.19235 type:complete len:103 (+) Transcript_7677:42-350(+)
MVVADSAAQRHDVVLLTTSMAATRKMQVECRRMQMLLEAKPITVAVVDLAREQDRMWHAKAGRTNGEITLPQVLVDGRTLGTAAMVQNLEDEGSLNGILGVY